MRIEKIQEITKLLESSGTDLESFMKDIKRFMCLEHKMKEIEGRILKLDQIMVNNISYIKKAQLFKLFKEYGIVTMCPAKQNETIKRYIESSNTAWSYFTKSAHLSRSGSGEYLFQTNKVKELILNITGNEFH